MSGIVRQGLTADRSGFAKRLWKMRDEPMPGAVLVLMADDVRLRHARRVLDTTDVPALFALEQNALRAGADDPIWHPTRVAASVNLPYVLERTDAGGEIPVEDGPRLVSVPSDLPERGAAADMADHLLPVYLKPTEKRALDLVSDWPWITVTDLAGLLGVSVPKASQLVNPLEGFRLVARSSSAGMRLALTDRGLALLARRDRTSVGLARKRWSAAPEDPEAPFEWSNVAGRRGRQLLRNAEHTAAVHGFLAALTSQAPLLGWEIVQLDPPRRASRHFRHDEDALGQPRRLRRHQTRRDDLAILLGVGEKGRETLNHVGATRPLSSLLIVPRPTDDHGARPAVLVVFDDEIAATHFLRVAREEMRTEGVAVPLWVSHKEAVDALGPLGRAWRTPAEWESPRALPYL